MPNVNYSTTTVVMIRPALVTVKYGLTGLISTTNLPNNSLLNRLIQYLFRSTTDLHNYDWCWVPPPNWKSCRGGRDYW